METTQFIRIDFRKETRKTVCVSIPETLSKKIDAFCKTENISRSEFFRALSEKYLTEQKN